jgi:hypothetical protein
MSTSPVTDDLSLSAKWRERFAFFDQYGAPSSKEAVAGYRVLPYKKKMLINFNFYALFFGPLYFFLIGLWKSALSLIGLAFVVGALGGVLHVPDAVFNGVGCAFSFLFGITANYAYYLKKVKGRQSWNPFAGLRMR